MYIKTHRKSFPVGNVNYHLAGDDCQAKASPWGEAVASGMLVTDEGCRKPLVYMKTNANS